MTNEQPALLLSGILGSSEADALRVREARRTHIVEGLARVFNVAPEDVLYTASRHPWTLEQFYEMAAAGRVQMERRPE